MEKSPARAQSESACRYQVYDVLASGGMATLHYGRMLGSGTFARTIAIKRLHSELAADPSFVAMLLDEARLVSRIRHPNVVPVLDVVHTERELFLALEYVHGDSLATLLRRSCERGRPPEARIVVAIMSAVLHGLHAAHEATDERGAPLGIVHRDVSPQNILVGMDGIARVVDFGIAKAAGRIQTTREGQLKGKLAYMAPEQLRSGEITRQVDVYAAAVCCWEALTGERLFPGDSEGGVIATVLNATVQPPSTRGERIPRALDPIVMRGVERDVTRRYATAREMAVHLEACLAPATQSELAAWVEQCVGDVLALRSARIAEIERGLTPLSNAQSVEEVRQSDAKTVAEAAAPRERTRAGRALAATLGIGAIVAVPFFAIWHSRANDVATSSPVNAPPAQTASEPPAPAATTTPAAVKASSPPPSATPRSAPPPVSRAHPKSAGSCNPAYVVDEQGHKLYKPECFH